MLPADARRRRVVEEIADESTLCRRELPSGELMTNCRQISSTQSNSSSSWSYGSSCYSRTPWSVTAAACYCMMAVLLTCFDIACCSNPEVDQPYVRYPEELFSEKTLLFDRLVTCSPNATDVGFVFPAKTWSCYDIKVDKLPVRTCYAHAVGPHSKCIKEDNLNDFGAICRHLLKLNNVNGDLKAALIVPDLHLSSADYDGRQRRVALLPHGSTFTWHESTEIGGRVKNLRCMLTS